MPIAALIALRLAVNALVCRVALGLSRWRLWRTAAMTLVADAVVAGLALALTAWLDRAASAAPLRRHPYLPFVLAAAGMIAALFIWESVLRLAARPVRLPPRRLGAAALALLLSAPVVTAIALLPLFASIGTGVGQPAKVTRNTVRVAGLPREFEGLQVCLVSDLHLGLHASAAEVRARLKALTGLHPDLMLFLGDYASGAPRFEQPAAAIIAEQKAPLGVYAVLGNHDRWVGEEYALRTLRRAGVRVLVNQSIALKRGGGVLYLAGVDDPYTGAADLDAALAAVPRGACVILMAHAPEIVDQARARRVALVVAGHTHGGQIVLPIIGAPAIRSIYARGQAHGLFCQGATALFVTRGVGEIFPYVRFNCPREIAMLRLAAGRSKRTADRR
jgi:hypothetical protein